MWGTSWKAHIGQRQIPTMLYGNREVSGAILLEAPLSPINSVTANEEVQGYVTDRECQRFCDIPKEQTQMVGALALG
jgi:hypothetical protein